MALPTLTKTWQFNVNNAQAALGSALADNKRCIRLLKNALIGFGTNPWTMFYSCNSVTAGTAGDGVDRIAADADVVFNSGAGNVRTWFVLKQTGVGSNFQLLWTANGSVGVATGVQGSIKISPSAGFTGGSTISDPSATDQITLTGSQWTSLVTDLAIRWSVMQSTDGQCTRVFVYAAGALELFWSIEKFANATGGAPGADNSGWMTIVTSLGGQTRQNGVTATTIVSYEATSNISIASEVSGVFDIFPLAVACTGTVGARGRLGTLQDMWLTSSSITAGDTFPATGSPAAQFIVLTSTLVLPWNNGAYNLT